MDDIQTLVAKTVRLNSLAFTLAIDAEKAQQTLSPDEIDEFVAANLGPYFANKKSIAATISHFHGIYTLGDNLIEQMSLIAEAWVSSDKPLDEGTKKQIAVKIEERASQCTPGFHNGTNELVKLLTNTESLETYLQLMREDIVNQASMALGNTDTHKHERVFCTARINNLGVRANSKDVYVGNLTNKKVLAQLEKSFTEKYRPVLIIEQVMGKMRTVLREQYRYRGLNKSPDGYRYGDYNDWHAFFKHLFNFDGISVEDICVLSEEYAVKDINWGAIQRRLVNRFLNEYFSFGKTNLGFLFAETLHNTFAQDNLASIIKDLFNHRILKDAIDINAFISLMSADLNKIPVAVGWVNALDAPSLVRAFTQLDSYPELKIYTPNTLWSDKITILSDEMIVRVCEACPQNIVAFIPLKPSLLEYCLAGKSDEQALKYMSALCKDKDAEFVYTYLLGAITARTPKSLIEYLYFFETDSKLSNVWISFSSYEQLLERDIFNNSILAFAIKYLPSSVPSLLEAVKKLDKEKQTLILTQLDNYCCNALMIATKNEPAFVKLFLQVISRLDKPQQTQILTQVTPDGLSALFVVIEKQSPAAKTLLRIIATLSKEQRDPILAQIDFKMLGNALLVASANQPTVIEPLLHAITMLDKKNHAQIMAQVDNNGSNALMIAAKYQPTVVESILQTIAALPNAQQKLILGKVELYSYNALMIAATYNPTAVKPILQTIATFNKEQQAQILAQVDYRDRNVLMLATTKQPTVVKRLLRVIATLGKEQQAQILTQIYPSGSNVLVVAIKYQPTVVKPFLQAIAALDKEQQAQILNQTEFYNYNALMIAATYEPTAVEPILQTISTLDKQQQAQILTQVDYRNRNALLIGAIKQPTVVRFLLQTIATLEKEQRDKILNQIKYYYWSGEKNLLEQQAFLVLILEAVIGLPITLNKKYKFVLNIHHALLHTQTLKVPVVINNVWQKDIATIMDELEQYTIQREALGIQEKYADKHFILTKKLCNDINNVFSRFLESNQSSEAFERCRISMTRCIRAAQRSDVLNGAPQLKKILKTAFLVLSVVGIIYLLYKTTRKKPNYRSQFFPSTKEAPSNTLKKSTEDAKKRVAH